MLHICTQVITIGDCAKAETRAYFLERLLPQVPERIRAGLDFEVLFDTFGGKLAHWQDYIAEYGKPRLLLQKTRPSYESSSLHTVNSNGNMDGKRYP